MTRPRKVLHVLNNAGGGAALSTVELMRSMASEGIRSCAVCHDSGTPLERAALAEAAGGDVLFTRLYWLNRKIRMSMWRRPLSEAKQIVATGWSLGSSAQVARFAREMAVDLIHTNTSLNPEGGRAAFRLALPHVWHVRELLGRGNPFRLWREGAAFGRYMARYASKVVANSHASAAPIRDWLPEGLLEIVPNGIDISRFHPRAPRSDPRQPLVVAMVGNLTSRSKKHGLLIDAAARVDASLPIEWRIYGHDPSAGGTKPGDPYVDELHERIARLGLQSRFAWPGFSADQPDIMSQIDLLVHPADNESFGRIVVEAMAAGLPVVGVRGGGVGEIVVDGETGLLAPADDAGALAKAIERLAQDLALRTTMGRAGRKRAETCYSLSALTAAMLRVYEQAIERPLGRGDTP
jgi:glycosyltransferase involved in cell wall biosynthesis